MLNLLKLVGIEVLLQGNPNNSNPVGKAFLFESWDMSIGSGGNAFGMSGCLVSQAVLKHLI